jgi:hypothetical protein
VLAGKASRSAIDLGDRNRTGDSAADSADVGARTDKREQ